MSPCTNKIIINNENIENEISMVRRCAIAVQ